MPFGQKKRLFRSMNIKKHTFSSIKIQKSRVRMKLIL